METAKVGRTVKDVSPHEFVKAYSAHLKRSGKYIYKHISHITTTEALFGTTFFAPVSLDKKTPPL
ncbi:40S ribosomal protein S19-3 [Platanthera guangdongensis]|uniref:40S ribosomal protein S19-3 n=1 Tax=Platanthera guangdongensis TaxID=2320717 RepID=A0ABR2MUB2_9ASPA